MHLCAGQLRGWKIDDTIAWIVFFYDYDVTEYMYRTNIVNAKQMELQREGSEAKTRKRNSLVITFQSESQIKPERSTDYNLVQVSQFDGKVGSIVGGGKKKIIRVVMRVTSGGNERVCGERESIEKLRKKIVKEKKMKIGRK